jgi:hypothetical protein
VFTRFESRYLGQGPNSIKVPEVPITLDYCPQEPRHNISELTIPRTDSKVCFLHLGPHFEL